MSNFFKILNVGRYICGDFTPTGTPYNFTIQNQPVDTQGGSFYTGWSTAPTNPSDSIYAIKLSSGSYVEITYSGTSPGIYGLRWEGLNFRPEAVADRQGESFALYSGTTPLHQLTTFFTPVKVSGFLPRQYNYLILRPVFFSTVYNPPFPRITVSGNFGFLAPTPNCLKITNVGTNICATSPTNCVKINDVKIPFPPPPNNLTATNITPTSFTVNWNSVSTATSYRLDISTNPTFTTNLPAYNNLTVNGTSQSVIGLIPGATYYIRVRSVNARGTSDNSGTLTQTTLSEAPAAPNTPTATNVTQTSFTANWNSVVGATSYRIDVSTTSNFSTNLAGYNDLTVNSTSQSVTGLTANTIYYIRVRATNGIGTSSSSSTLIQTTLSNIPLPPSSLSTSNVTQTSFTLSWNPVAGATSYRVDISTSPTFETNLSQYNNLSVLNSFLNVIGLTPATTYYMRVRTVNSGGTSSSTSPLTQATASGPPPAPTMLTAIDITQTSFTANWNSVVGATSYRIDVSTSLTFATNLIGYNNLIVSGTSQSITGLTAGTTYYVRVRAVSNGGESGNSSTLIQTTLNINIPAAPTNLNYRDLYGSYFTLLWDLDGSSWLPGTSLEHFILDVSPNINFSSFVNNYQNRIVTNFASLQITGLNLNTNYYARLKTVVSYNGNIVTSDNSSTLSLKTLPLNGIHFKIDNSTVTRTVQMPIQENLYANERYTIPLMFDPAFASGAIQSGFNLQNLALSIRNIIDEDSFGTILGFTGTRFHLLTDDGDSEIQNYGVNWIFIPALENKIPTDELAASAKVRSNTVRPPWWPDLGVGWPLVPGSNQGSSPVGEGAYSYQGGSWGTGINQTVNAGGLLFILEPSWSDQNRCNWVQCPPDPLPCDPEQVGCYLDNPAGYKFIISSQIPILGRLALISTSGIPVFVNGMEVSKIGGGDLPVSNPDGSEDAPIKPFRAGRGYTELSSIIPGFTYKPSSIDKSEGINCDPELFNAASLTCDTNARNPWDYTSRVKSLPRLLAEYGQDRENIPSPPYSLTLSNITKDSVDLTYLPQMSTLDLVDISRDKSFYSIDQSLNPNTVELAYIQNLDLNMQYHIRVRSRNIVGISDYSNTVSFSTLKNLNAPPAPYFLTGTNITTTGFRVSWNSAPATYLPPCPEDPNLVCLGGPNPITYNIDVSTGNMFFSFVHNYNNLTVNTNFINLTGLNPGTIYYVRVRTAHLYGVQLTGPGSEWTYLPETSNNSPTFTQATV